MQCIDMFIGGGEEINVISYIIGIHYKLFYFIYTKGKMKSAKENSVGKKFWKM